MGLASPNPTVGCVLLRDGQILGEGAHYYDAFDHAEIAAIKRAVALGNALHGATAYVTLEPCSHHGRTGPCADALLAAGIKRCVIATVDPNPAVRGNGIARLRAGGVDVEVASEGSVLAQEARRLNDAFAYWIQHHRPFVTLKAAASRDGKLAPAPHARADRTPHWLTGEAARADVQLLRHANDAILTGVGTILADNPSLTDRSGLPRRRALLRVILDSRLRTPVESKLFAATRPNTTASLTEALLVCSPEALTAREDALRERGVEVLHLTGSDERIELRAVLAALAERNITSLLVEAGPAVNGSFLRENLVDKVVLYQADCELGPDAMPFAEDVSSPELLLQQLTRVERASFPHGDTEDIRISGYLEDPWSGI